ncbi:ferritin family protein [Vallitalea okinawensis]|uniref:ferritin family protein n=1 Tax=Vallitalea okinawensis TaxID=2078660 RepID=UPI000CFB33B5|nr:ferritin family protein [Vallitalea okinawensis]
MMHPYRCVICGETSLVSAAPERCPFCGSDRKNLLPAAEWIGYGEVEMCEKSYRACEIALGLELDNYAFYKCSAAKAENQVTQAIFERLMEQELEHAEVFAEAMGIPFHELETDRCSESDFINMKKSNKHEVRAIKFYTKVANEAPEPRIKQIFSVIAEVEQEHLIVTNMYLPR